MKIKHIISIIAVMLFLTKPVLSQITTDPFELDEIVLSIPFSQTLGKSVIKVDKINMGDINPILKQYISKSISKLPGVSLITTGASMLLVHAELKMIRLRTGIFRQLRKVNMIYL